MAPEKAPVKTGENTLQLARKQFAGAVRTHICAGTGIFSKSNPSGLISVLHLRGA
jgi:hypothetical protein